MEASDDVMTRNPFEPDPEFDKRFWTAYPRWTFRNGWKGYNGTHAFSPFSIWWSRPGSFGLSVMNFSVEFNPNHREPDATLAKLTKKEDA